VLNTCLEAIWSLKSCLHIWRFQVSARRLWTYLWLRKLLSLPWVLCYVTSQGLVDKLLSCIDFGQITFRFCKLIVQVELHQLFKAFLSISSHTFPENSSGTDLSSIDNLIWTKVASTIDHSCVPFWIYIDNPINWIKSQSCVVICFQNIASTVVAPFKTTLELLGWTDERHSRLEQVMINVVFSDEVFVTCEGWLRHWCQSVKLTFVNKFVLIR